MVGGGWPHGAYLMQVLLAEDPHALPLRVELLLALLLPYGPHALPLRVELLLALLLVQLLALGLFDREVVEPLVLGSRHLDGRMRKEHAMTGRDAL